MSGSNLLKTKINLDSEIINLIETANEQILIYSPYIKLDALKSILLNRKNRTSVTIITTWKKSDVAFGSTDLDVYLFCKENRIQLRINNNIHLKCIAVDGMKRAYIGSANITNSGLALGNNYNYKIDTIIENLSGNDKINLHELINSNNHQSTHKCLLAHRNHGYCQRHHKEYILHYHQLLALSNPFQSFDYII